MSYLRTPYADAATPREMAGDASIVDQVLHLPHQPTAVRETPTPTLVTVTADTASLAGRFSA